MATSFKFKSFWPMLLVLAGVQFTHIMDFMILMPLGPQLMRIFEITPFQFSLLVTGYTFSAGIVSILSSMFIDRFERKKTLMTFYVGFIVSTLCCAVAPTYQFFLAARILAGAFGGVAGAICYAIVGDQVPESHRAQGIGVVMTSFSMAAVFGVPFGLFLATKLGWHAPFYFLAFTGVLIWMLMSKMVPRSPISAKVEGSRPWTIYGDVIKTKIEREALMLTSILMLGHFVVIPFLSPYMVSNVGISESDLSYIYLLGGLATFFSAPQVGRLADKFGKAEIFIVATLLALAPIWMITHLMPAPLYSVLLITTVFFIFTNARMIPSTSIATSVVKANRRAGFMSLNSAFGQISAGVASLLAGYLVSKREDGQLMYYDRAAYFAVLTSIICIFIALRLRMVLKPLNENRTSIVTTAID